MGKPRAIGSDAVLIGVTEATYDVAPTTGYFSLPFKDTDLDRERPLATDDLLGQGRTAQGAYYQRSNVAGNMTVPIDVRASGFWLHKLLGAPTSTPASATGEITFSGQPANDSTITLNGTVWTFKTSGAAGPQTDIGVSLAATLTQLAIDLNASANAEVAKCTYNATATALTMSVDTPGVAGNAFTLAASAPSNGTVSASTMLGGGYQHVFTAGGATPTAALQVGHIGLNTPTYFLYTGCFAGGWNTQISGDGPANTQINIIGRQKLVRATTIDAAPASYQLDRFQNSRAGITYLGDAISFLTAGTFVFSNELQAFNEINAESVIGGVDPGVARTSGTMTVRLSDSATQIALQAEIDAEHGFAFAYRYTHPKRWSLIFNMPRTLLSAAKAPITGPAGIEQTFTWMAENDTVSGFGMQAVLINDVASYA